MITSTSQPSSANHWQRLPQLGAWSALILLAYSLATLLMMVLTGGQPETVDAIFKMLREDRFVGLLRLDLLTVLVMPLYYVLFLSFWALLKQVDGMNAVLSTILVFAGLTLFLATPSVFSYLFLSDRYAAAASDIQRAQILAAGEAILASDMWHGTGALIGGLLMQSGAVLISAAMLRGGVFSKATAYAGLVTHGLDLAHAVVGLFSPVAGMILMGIAGPLYLVWFPLIARDLFRAAAKARAARSLVGELSIEAKNAPELVGQRVAHGSSQRRGAISGS